MEDGSKAVVELVKEAYNSIKIVASEMSRGNALIDPFFCSFN
jgi:hypothetical protein